MTIYPQQGAVMSKTGTCVFRVWAPERKKVELIISSPVQEQLTMLREEEGYWSYEMPGCPSGLRYHYLLDGELHRPDPASRCQPEGVHGDSEVTDGLSFNWTDQQWKGLALKDMLIYELHTGTFTEQGTFQGIISRLDDLLQLGINTIEIMPIAQFPGTRNWGYDGVYPYAVQSSYGGCQGLRQLVDAAHAKGLAVVLDVVYNHLGPEGNYLPEFGPYFTDKYHTPWGSAINYDDRDCDAVRGYFLHNALMWLDEFHIDGLRLDAVHAWWDSSAVHFAEELSAAVKDLEVRTGRKKVLIAEIDLNNPRYITPADKGGYGMQGQWCDEFHHAIHGLLTGEKNGYYEDFGEAEHMAAALEHAYVYTGQYSKHRKRRFGASPKNNARSQFVVFTQNHDQVGNRMLGERLISLAGESAARLAAATMLLSPYVPLLFMGEEYGETKPFSYFTSHSDEALIKAVREGRQQEFAAFQTGKDVPDPQSEELYKQCVLNWKTSGPMYEYYRHLIALRKGRAPLQNDAPDSMIVHPAYHAAVLSFERHAPEEKLLVLLNFAKEEQQCTPAPGCSLKKISDSEDINWNGKGKTAPDEVPVGGSITLPPLSAVVYEMI
ncbi:malto-oligosyltrehalose trehalohydrolase [Chitinophaga horti]|uniref:Malto-oligosyltrehalose trehalohydrolase n=1 Tax=Chitinophaga horti TaxID=2920382 RepID=A0ABY6J8G5_9BACT|nr:malto-oligosyltrehalose trehalohydrolase [Chitinophaga horti]UYQ94571.1 malto-oligosyltrehalose trehalohydrolase [Chitinophaga horti]